MSVADVKRLQSEFLNPEAIAKAFLHEQITPEQLDAFVNGDLEARRAFYRDFVDHPDKVPFFADKLNRFDLTRDEREAAVTNFLLDATYTVKTLDAVEDFIEESDMEWNDDAVELLLGNNEDYLEQQVDVVKAKKYDPPAASVLLMRNALRGETNAEEELKDAQKLPGAEQAAEKMAQIGDGMLKVEEDLATIYNAYEVNEAALEPDVDEDDGVEYDEVIKSEEFTADPFGFTPEEEVAFGWRNSAPEVKDKGFNFGNLKFDDSLIKTQKVDAGMIMDSIKKEAKACESLDAVREKLTTRRDQLMAYVYGSGDPRAAFDCLIDEKSRKNGTLTFDQAKLRAMKDALSDREIERQARAVYGEREPEDQFGLEWDTVGDKENPNKTQMKYLKEGYRNMKELHECRSFGYMLLHPINYFKEARSIARAEGILRDQLHIDPATLLGGGNLENIADVQPEGPVSEAKEPTAEPITVPEANDLSPEKTEVVTGDDAVSDKALDNDKNAPESEP